MRKRWIRFIGGTLILGAALWGGNRLLDAGWARHDWSGSLQQRRDALVTQVATQERRVLSEVTLAAQEAPRPAPGARLIEAPLLGAYVSEAKRNPHHVPRSLMRFADSLADQMERALISRERAALLYPELERCARDERGEEPVSVRAVCAVNAGRLAERYPDLFGRRFRGVRGALPSEVGFVVGSAGY